MLRDIVARERQLFARAVSESEEFDSALFAGEAQAIATSYDVLIQKAPDFAPAYVAYGMFLGKTGMDRAAVVTLVKANKLDPNLALVKNQLAKHLAEAGQPLEALAYLNVAIQLAPGEPLYHYHLGQLLLAARDDFLEKAQFTRSGLDNTMLQAFARATELAPDNWEYALQHAKAYYEVEPPRWDEALALWEKLGTQAKSSALRELTWLHRARILSLTGHRDEARALVDQITSPELAAEKLNVFADTAPDAKTK